MKAITVEPKKPGSARCEDAPEPDERDGSVLVEAVAVGVCGTDAEIVEGKYGWAPPGKGRLVLGHESLGRVIDPGPRGGLEEGRPRRGHRAPAGPRSLPELRRRRVGHVPQRPSTPSAASSRSTASCPSAGGSSPSTRSRWTRRWASSACCSSRPPSWPRRGSRCRSSASGRSGSRSTCSSPAPGRSGCWPRSSAVQRGLDVHVLDRMTSGPKPELVRALGATYHSGDDRRARLRAGHRHRVHGRRPGDRGRHPRTSAPAASCA